MIKRQYEDLIFISQIGRDGKHLDFKEIKKSFFKEEYEVYSLSITEETYLACDSMNWYVVKLKPFNNPKGEYCVHHYICDHRKHNVVCQKTRDCFNIVLNKKN